MWSAGVDGQSTEVVDGGRRTRWGGHGVRVERSGRHDITGRIEVVWEELRVYREEEKRERERKVAVDECGQRPV
jgi:hypothetical protein